MRDIVGPGYRESGNRTLSRISHGEGCRADYPAAASLAAVARPRRAMIESTDCGL